MGERYRADFAGFWRNVVRDNTSLYEPMVAKGKPAQKVGKIVAAHIESRQLAKRIARLLNEESAEVGDE